MSSASTVAGSEVFVNETTGQVTTALEGRAGRTVTEGTCHEVECKYDKSEVHILIDIHWLICKASEAGIEKNATLALSKDWTGVIQCPSFENVCGNAADNTAKKAPCRS